jgi:hypothetical protein
MIRRLGTEPFDEVLLLPYPLHNRMKLFQLVRSFAPDCDYRFSIDKIKLMRSAMHEIERFGIRDGIQKPRLPADHRAYHVRGTIKCYTD